MTDPTDDVLARLIEEERANERLPAARGAQILEALETALDAEQAPDAEPASDEGPPGDAEPSPGSGSSIAERAASAGLSRAHGAWLFAAGLAVGGALGAIVSPLVTEPARTVEHESERAREPEPAAEVPPPAEPSPEPEPSEPEPSEPEPSEPEPPPRRGQRTQPPAQPADDEAPAASVDEERALIDAARGALARGNTDEALAALGRHARRFPDGHLVEEREGLRVLSLARLDPARARAAAERFRARYPRSVLRGAIDREVPP